MADPKYSFDDEKFAAPYKIEPSGPVKKPMGMPRPPSNKSLKDIQAEYASAQKSGADAQTLAGIADSYVARERQDGGFGGALLFADNVARATARGVPIVGAGLDEATAGTNALFGGNYGETLDYQRARDRDFDTNYPWLSTGLQIAGGVASGIGAGRLFNIARYGATPSTAAMPATFMPKSSQALTAAGVAVPAGFADGFLRGEGDDRAKTGAITAAVAAPLAAAAPYVAGGLANLTQKTGNVLNRNARLSRLGVSPEAARVVVRRLDADDTQFATGLARIRAAGPQGMLADAGPASSGLLDTAIQRSGKGSTAAREAIENRMLAANKGMRGLLDDTLGPPVGVRTRQAAIRAKTAAERSMLYDDVAYQQPINYASEQGDELLRLLKGVNRRTIRTANELLKEDGHLSKQIKFTIDADGAVKFERMPDVREVDYITRAINSKVNREGYGATGGMTDQGRIWANQSRKIRDTLRTLVPEYDDALQKGKDVIRQINATEFGSTILDQRVTREMLAEQLKNIPAAERTAMMSGLRDQIDEIMGAVRRAQGSETVDPRQVQEMLSRLSADNVREKFKMLLGPEKARNFFKEIEKFEKASLLSARTAANSATFPRMATDAQVNAQLDGGVIDNLLSNPVKASGIGMRKLTGQDPLAMLDARDQLYGEVANLLTTKRGKDAERLLQQLQGILKARGQNTVAAQRAGAYTRGGLLATTPQGGPGLLNYLEGP